MILDVRSGQVDGTDVSGSKVALLADWPGGFLLGNGKGRVHFDPGVSQAKRSVLGPLFTGKMGGVFEAIGALIPTIESGPDAAIAVQSVGDDRRLTVGDFVNLTITPLKGPTGEKTRVLHGAAAFREDTLLGRSAGSVRPQGMKSWENTRGHAEEADFDWNG